MVVSLSPALYRRRGRIVRTGALCHNGPNERAGPPSVFARGVPMGNTRTVWEGDIAPDFTLKDQHNRDFKLSDFAGRRVLLSFHPLAWTPVCGEQMKALESRKAELDALGTIAVGISVDTFP